MTEGGAPVEMRECGGRPGLGIFGFSADQFRLDEAMVEGRPDFHEQRVILIGRFRPG
jgi:hypothetical protein